MRKFFLMYFLWQLAGALGYAEIKHVIHISVDGLRGDALLNLISEPESAYVTFRRIHTQGATTYNARCDYSHSITVPNHTTMLTGRPVVAEPPLPLEIQHGYLANSSSPTTVLHEAGFPKGYKASTFDRVHDHGGRTGLFVSKDQLFFFSHTYGPQFGAPDITGEDNGRNKVDVAFARHDDTSLVVARLISEMNGDFPAYSFLHLCDPDYAGHGYGWSTLNWRLAVLRTDALLGVIMGALDLRPELKATTALVITADHGGGVPDYTHVDPIHIENITIPVLLWGSMIPRGVDAYTLFQNRFDPGSRRVDNIDPQQPLRNGDTGNIAMALLGLPPVEGSFHRPEFRVDLEIMPGEFSELDLSLRWPAYLPGWQLEVSDSLREGSWEPIDQAPLRGGDGFYRVYVSPVHSQRFYRLRHTD